jgi:hypothetical protein
MFSQFANNLGLPVLRQGEFRHPLAYTRRHGPLFIPEGAGQVSSYNPMSPLPQGMVRGLGR